jgi:hypothetical protein
LEQKKNSAYTTSSLLAAGFPKDAQLDFQVEAVLYYEGRIKVYQLWYDFTGSIVDGYISDQGSGWSNTQTISLADGLVSVSTSSNPTISPSSTPSPTVPEFSWLAIVPLFASSLFIAVILTHRKLNKKSNQPLPSLQN